MAKNLLLEYSEELATKCELLCKSISGNSNTAFSASQVLVKRVRKYHRGAVSSKPCGYALQIQDRKKRVRRNRKLAQIAL